MDRRHHARALEAGVRVFSRRFGQVLTTRSRLALDRNLTSRLTLAALKKAIEERNPGPWLVHHSDRGPQYVHAGYPSNMLASTMLKGR
jgi:hypothetical protein